MSSQLWLVISPHEWNDLLHYYFLFTESQKLLHLSVNVYLSVEIGTEEQFIVISYFYSLFFLEVWGSC